VASHGGDRAVPEESRSFGCSDHIEEVSIPSAVFVLTIDSCASLTRIVIEYDNFRTSTDGLQDPKFAREFLLGAVERRTQVSAIHRC
jgi:hypothetical protein